MFTRTLLKKVLLQKAQFILGFFISVSAFSVSSAASTISAKSDLKRWKIATLEWPPFACNTECDRQGAMAVALEKVLKTQGIHAEYVFFPWTRAVHESSKHEFIGFYPSWPEDCMDPKKYFFSEVITRSPFGFIAHQAFKGKIQKVEDLSKYRLGTVKDYGNTFKINQMIKEGQIQYEEVSEEPLNILKIAAQRIELALFDKNVFEFTIKRRMPQLKETVVFGDFVFENKSLGICFRRELGPELNQKLKKGLRQVQAQKIVDEYLKSLN
jgi:polar amino acid transport system substrate-binding protein